MPKKFTKVQFNDYKPLRDVIFDTIRQAITTGELKPGERLMEVTLARKMGVSRTPVREAIRRLELEGLIKMTPRRGAYVANLTIKDIIDVLEIRASLDSLATALSAKRATQNDVKELKQIHSQFEKVVKAENLQGSIKRDVEFHEVIYRSSGNEKLIRISNNLREQFHRFRVIFLKDLVSPKELIKEHLNILEAIEKKNSDLAAKQAKTHVENQKEVIIKAMKEKEENI